MENLLQMAMAVRQYHIDMYKGMNQLTRNMAALQFDMIEQMAFRRSFRPTAGDGCDQAEKGLTCAMPL